MHTIEVREGQAFYANGEKFRCAKIFHALRWQATKIGAFDQGFIIDSTRYVQPVRGISFLAQDSGKPGVVRAIVLAETVEVEIDGERVSVQDPEVSDLPDCSDSGC